MIDPSTRRQLSLRLGIGILLLPPVFAWFTLKRGYPMPVRVIAFIWMVVTLPFIAAIIYTPFAMSDPHFRAQMAARAAADKAKREQAAALKKQQDEQKAQADQQAQAAAASAKASTPSAYDHSDFRAEYSPTNRKSDPELFRAWGSAGVSRIDALRVEAAKKVATNPRCDNVELSELNDRASHPPENIHVFVDCKNGQRFEISAADIDQPLISNQEKGAKYDAGALIVACADAVKARMNYPSTYSTDLFSTGALQDPTNGNWRVVLNYHAMNGFGAKLPGSAVCIVTPDGKAVITLGR